MTKAKNVQEYIAHQRAAIATNPECGTSHYNLAIGLLGLKKYEEAEKELLTAVECSPNLAEAYVQLGGICLQRGDIEGCLKYNKMSVQARAGFSEGYGNIGFAQLQLGNFNLTLPWHTTIWPLLISKRESMDLPLNMLIRLLSLDTMLPLKY